MLSKDGDPQAPSLHSPSSSLVSSRKELKVLSGTAIFVAATHKKVASRAYIFRSPRTVNKIDKPLVRPTEEKSKSETKKML